MSKLFILDEHGHFWPDSSQFGITNAFHMRVGRSARLFLTNGEHSEGLSLENPGNFSGPKRQLSTCKSLFLESLFFNVFNVRKRNCGTRNIPEKFRDF